MPHRTRWFALALIIGFQSIPGWAQSADPQPADQKTPDQKIQDLEQKVEELDQRVKVAERNKELSDEDTADKARTGATVGAEPAGITIRSNDQNFLLRIGIDLQVDNRTFLGESSVPLTDQILIRRARPALSGTIYKNIDFYFRPDFGQGQVVLYEAYIELKYFSMANLRVGKFKPPVGLERLQSDDDTNFMERGYPTLLVPSRDIGYQLSGDFVKDRVSYSIGVFNGVPDNSLSDASASDHRDYAGRIFLTPFQPNTKSILRGLGIGIGASSGNVDGLTLPGYKTFGQNSFLPFASGVISMGHRTRLAPQLYYYAGPFGLISEYTLAEEGFQKGNLREPIAFRAWQVSATYLLTREKKTFGTLVPRRPFDPRNHTWGAFELAARVSDFDAEQAIYNYGFASSATAARRAHEWIGGVSWYLNRSVRLELDYGNTNFEGGAAASAGGNRPSERALLQRFQINF